MRGLTYTLFIIFWVISANLKVEAQTLGTSNPTGTLQVQIAQVLDLSVTNGSSVDFSFGSLAVIDAGIEHDKAVTLTFRSNQPWFVNVAASTTNFTGGNVKTPMPSSVLQYRLGGTTAFTPVSTTATALTGAKGSENARGAGTIGVDYKMNPGYIYGPGNYSITLTYTISNL